MDSSILKYKLKRNGDSLVWYQQPRGKVRSDGKHLM